MDGIMKMGSIACDQLQFGCNNYSALLTLEPQPSDS